MNTTDSYYWPFDHALIDTENYNQVYWLVTWTFCNVVTTTSISISGLSVVLLAEIRYILQIRSTLLCHTSVRFYTTD